MIRSETLFVPRPAGLLSFRKPEAFWLFRQQREKPIDPRAVKVESAKERNYLDRMSAAIG